MVINLWYFRANEWLVCVQNKFCVTEFRTENSGYRQNKEETGRKELLEVGLLDMVTMEAMPWSVFAPCK